MSRLGEFLSERKLVTPAQVEAAVQHQVLYGGRLGTNLVDLNHLSVDELAQALSQLHKTPLPTYAWLENPDPAAVRKVSRPLVEKHRFVPLRLEGRLLHLAVMDPHDPLMLDELRFATGCRLKVYVLPELLMHDWLEWLFRVPRTIRHVDTTRAPKRKAPADPAQSRARKAEPGRERPGVDMGGWQDKPASEPTGPRSADGNAPTGGEPRSVEGGPWEADRATPVAKAATQRAQSRHAEPSSPLISSPLQPPPPADAPPRTAAGEAKAVAVTNPPVQAKPEQAANPPGEAEAEPAAESASAGKAEAEPARVEQPPELAASQEEAETTEVPAVPSADAAADTGASAEPLATGELAPASLGGTGPTPSDVAGYERQMGLADDREALIEQALMAATGFASYAALLVVHQGMVEGLAGCRAGFTPEPIGGVLVPTSADSEFARMTRSAEGRRVQLGGNNFDARMLERLGRDDTEVAAMFPIALRGRVINVLYADNGVDALSESGVAALGRLAELIGEAYANLILRRKGREVSFAGEHPSPQPQAPKLPTPPLGALTKASD